MGDNNENKKGRKKSGSKTIKDILNFIILNFIIFISKTLQHENVKE